MFGEKLGFHGGVTFEKSVRQRRGDVKKLHVRGQNLEGRLGWGYTFRKYKDDFELMRMDIIIQEKVARGRRGAPACRVWIKQEQPGWETERTERTPPGGWDGGSLGRRVYQEDQLVHCQVHSREDKGPGSCVEFATWALLVSLLSADLASEGGRPEGSGRGKECFWKFGYEDNKGRVSQWDVRSRKVFGIMGDG